MMQFQSLQQNLNQIAQICNQLSQSEQANISRLNQIQEIERTAVQQLQQAAQLCSQISQQMQQVVSSGQFANPAQYSSQGQYQSYPSTGVAPGNYQTSSWANRPVNTGNFSANFETSKELGATGTAVYNTNKDLNQ